VIVAVAASPSVDMTYVVNALTPGVVHRPRAVLRLAGGKGINVARAAGQLRAAVAAVGVVGGGAGRWIVDSLRAEGIAFTAVPGTAETRTCVSIVDVADRSSTDVYPAASSLGAGEWAALEEAITKLVARRGPRWVSVSGAFPTGAPDDAVERLTGLAHGFGAKVAVDTHGAMLERALRSNVDLIKVNQLEAAGLAGEADSTAGLCHALAARAGRGAQVVVTAGVDGAYTLSPGEPMCHVAPSVRGVYPVGSGDSFLAGLMVALSAGRDTGEALRLATVAAAANSRVPGAGRLDASALADWQ